MILGQSAATTAVLALDSKSAVQDVPYADLRIRLLADGQILDAEVVSLGTGGVDAETLNGIVVDDLHAKLKGNWSSSASSGKWVGTHYLHDGNSGDGKAVAVFETPLEHAGRYEVRIAWSQHANRASNVPVVIRHSGGESIVMIDQSKSPAIDERFSSVGTFLFSGTEPAVVAISNDGTDGYVIADAVQWIQDHESSSE